MYLFFFYNYKNQLSCVSLAETVICIERVELYVFFWFRGKISVSKK